MLGFKVAVTIAISAVEAGATTQPSKPSQRCVQPLLRYRGNQRLTAHYEVTIDANLRATNARITRRSGNAAFDNAVVNALKKPAKTTQRPFVTLSLVDYLPTRAKADALAAIGYIDVQRY